MSILLNKIYDQQNLTKAEMKEVADELFHGRFSDAQIGALLVALKIKGETAEEMAGIAELLREIAVQIPADPAGTMCNCGTGGDYSNSFNVSTTSAFVLAAAGIKVAKTGNRSISSKSGSFDTCEALGIDFMLSPKALGELLERVHLSFIFAPLVHPNMKYVMPTRKSLGIPTIMNLIGPLTNPVALEYQLMGTYRRDLLVDTARSIQQLGRSRAVVVSGPDSMDEASLAGENQYALLEKGEISLHSFTPEDLDLPKYEQAAITGGGPEQNAEILLEVLKGQKSAYYDTVLLNSGLGLYTCEKADTISSGIVLAREIIQSGAAYDKLQELLKAQVEVGA